MVPPVPTAGTDRRVGDQGYCLLPITIRRPPSILSSGQRPRDRPVPPRVQRPLGPACRGMLEGDGIRVEGVEDPAHREHRVRAAPSRSPRMRAQYALEHLIAGEQIPLQAFLGAALDVRIARGQDRNAADRAAGCRPPRPPWPTASRHRRSVHAPVTCMAIPTSAPTCREAYPDSSPPLLCPCTTCGIL